MIKDQGDEPDIISREQDEGENYDEIDEQFIQQMDQYELAQIQQ